MSLFARLGRGTIGLFLLFYSHSALADTAKVPETLYQAIQQNAVRALASGDKKEADFWMARYLGLSSVDPATGHSMKDLETLLKNRKLAPKAFVSGDWDEGFVDWFEKGLYPRWGVDEKKVRIKYRTFEIAQNRFQDRYFATIVASPELELWHVVENGLVSRPLLLLMGSASERPTLFFGKLFKGASSSQFSPLYLNTKKRPLHYVWKPEFNDLDGDGLPEVWVRFNLAWGNGFVQVLEIYRIQNDRELVLLKRFQSGEEGFALRLLDGTVEVGSAFDSHKTRSRLRYDSHRIETWNYEGGEFQKKTERRTPLILKTDEWKKYFLV